MSYYQGDYYQGDYYQGGLFSSIGKGLSAVWNKIARPAVVDYATNLVPGGKAIAAAVSGATRKVGSAIVQHPVLSAAGGASLAAGAALLHARAGAKVAGMPHMPGARGSSRRMNVCNPKALRRSIRRTHGFAKMAMKTIRLVHPQKKARFGGFKKRKRA
jgi:hypothetical protein